MLRRLLKLLKIFKNPSVKLFGVVEAQVTLTDQNLFTLPLTNWIVLGKSMWGLMASV